MSPEFPILPFGGDEWRPANKPRSVLIFVDFFAYNQVKAPKFSLLIL